MKKLFLAGIILMCLMAGHANAGKFYINANYSLAGYYQSTFTGAASVPINARLGYGIGYLFGTSDGLRFDLTFFSSASYDAVGGKANIDETAYELSWVFNISPEWYWSLGAGFAPTTSYLQSGGSKIENFGIGSFISLGHHFSEKLFLEGQWRADYSANGGLGHSLTGLNLKLGYAF